MMQKQDINSNLLEHGGAQVRPSLPNGTLVKPQKEVQQYNINLVGKYTSNLVTNRAR